MADELKLTVGVTYAKSSSVVSFPSKVFNGTITSGYKFDVDVNVGTSEEQVTLGDVTTTKCVIIENYDTTNFLEFGGATGVRPFRVDPLGVAVFRPISNALWLKADTAAVKARVIAMNA